MRRFGIYLTGKPPEEDDLLRGNKGRISKGIMPCPIVAQRLKPQTNACSPFSVMLNKQCLPTSLFALVEPMERIVFLSTRL